jgi:antitoxin VapB
MVCYTAGMRQTSIKSDRVADLIDRIASTTGESKVDAVTTALERRLKEIEGDARAERALDWLKNAVWPRLPEGIRGKAPTKEEQEELLGF